MAKRGGGKINQRETERSFAHRAQQRALLRAAASLARLHGAA